MVCRILSAIDWRKIRHLSVTHWHGCSMAQCTIEGWKDKMVSHLSNHNKHHTPYKWIHPVLMLFSFQSTNSVVKWSLFVCACCLWGTGCGPGQFGEGVGLGKALRQKTSFQHLFSATVFRIFFSWQFCLLSFCFSKLVVFVRLQTVLTV